MEGHLTNEEMDHYLRLIVNPEAVGSQDWQTSTEVQAHLNCCPECQSRLQAEEAYLHELKSFRSSGSQSKRKDCPPEEIWLQLAGNCVEKDSALYLDHAARCDSCSRLLREAMEDLQGPIDPEEQRRLAELEKLADTWARRAQALFRRANASERVGQGHSRERGSAIVALLSRHRIALGGAVFACLALGVLYRHSLDLAQQVRDSRASISRLEEDLRRQTHRASDLSAGMKDQRASAELGAIKIAKLSLVPGLTRGRGVVARLELPAETRYVEVTVESVDVRDGFASATLTTVEGQRRWSEEFPVSPGDVKDRRVSFVIPAESLPPNDYEVSLSQDSPNGKHELAVVTFRVTPNHP